MREVNYRFALERLRSAADSALSSDVSLRRATSVLLRPDGCADESESKSRVTTCAPGTESSKPDRQLHPAPFGNSGRARERFKDFAIDLGKTYGPGALIGSVRVASELPAFAARGHNEVTLASKVLEVPVGDNSYTVGLTFGKERTLFCDIAGFRTPVKPPCWCPFRTLGPRRWYRPGPTIWEIAAFRARLRAGGCSSPSPLKTPSSRLFFDPLVAWLALSFRPAPLVAAPNRRLVLRPPSHLLPA